MRGIVADWFVSYLANRSQYVKIDDTSSASLNVSCGVPQGSILGPLLFIIYDNDINNASNIAMFNLFADDTKLFFKHHDLNTLFKNINVELSEIAVWFKISKLSLIIMKTNYILFHGGNKKVHNLGLEIMIDNVKINQVDHTKFLDIIINSRLNWNDHIKTVFSKVSKSTAIYIEPQKNCKCCHFTTTISNLDTALL